ncbi:MAG: AAA family ATPase, partial [Pseudoflavonifractor sp.]
MKILSMTASFGKLQNARLELGGGLNLIVAPNEGGKSTWCAFLRAMLYGIPTNQRDKQGYIAEKNRYQPWNGGGMEGTMTLVWGDREITLRRGPRGSTPFGGFSAVYAGTEEPVPGLTGENCGERLLGVSREVYERSAFVGQGGAAIGPNGELEKRIAALVSSGEEEVSYSQVAKTLREWQNRRRHNATGIIPKLQNELAVLRDTLARQAQTCNQAEDAKRELDLLTLRQKELSADAETHRGLANEARREKYEAAAADLRAAELAADALTADLGQAPDTETLRDAQGAIAYLRTIEVNLKLARRQEEEAVQTADTRRALAQDPLFSGMTDEEAREQAAADGAQVDANRTRAAREARWRWLTAGIALLFLAAVAAAGWFLLPAMRTAVVGSCIGAFLGCAAVGIAVGSAKAKKHRAAADGILKRYGAENTSELFLLANDYALRYRDAEDA